jgi:glycine dehydrogenase subunit 1
MAYTPHTPADVEAMLAAIGVGSLDELFKDVPASLMLENPIDVPSMTEYEIERKFDELAGMNRAYPAGKSFLGAGAYRHYLPAAAKQLITRGEFMTAYTPYQAEVSQGTLQTIFEFQSHICGLTGLDVANASMYDGATALAEAITMSVRETGRHTAWLPELLHPHYRAVCETFLSEIDVEIKTIPAVDGRTDYSAVPAGEAAAVVINTPNALGVIEDGAAAREAATRSKGLLVAVVNPTSLAILASPGGYGADIAVGEGQPLGIPLSFGGPYAGFFACKQQYIRKMPGRIVGRTHDKAGNPGFVLTLQTREQHIRRDRATSNICTNQGLFALLTVMYVTFLGKQGLVEVAETSLVRTLQIAEGMLALPGVSRHNPHAHFHEIALRLPMPATEFLDGMAEHDILAGFALSRWWPGSENLLLVNATELNTRADVDAYIAAAKSVLAGVGAGSR